MAKKVYVVLLNWNGWSDTCQCLDSLLKMSPCPQIVVCDNASGDDSVVRMREWAHARGQRFVELDREQSLRGRAHRDGDIVLIQSGANLGFAGGCNVGVRYGLACGDADYFWLLNNDTVVDERALDAMLETAAQSENAGIVGSTLLYFHAPAVVQALGGGTLDVQAMRTHHIGEGVGWQPPDEARRCEVERQMDYVVGASMLLSRALVDAVGLLEEGYFLYYEEVDLAERARRASPPFSLAYAAGSIVWHKEGASAGTNRLSVTSSKWLARSRLRFASRFYPAKVARVRISTLIEALKHVIKGNFAISRVICQAALTNYE